MSYDSESDVLYFNKGISVQDSLDVGDFYLEFDGDGRVAGVEVLNASETISQLTGDKLGSGGLEDVVSAEIKVYVKGEFAFVVLYLWFERDGQKVQESVGFNVPSSTVRA